MPVVYVWAALWNIDTEVSRHHAASVIGDLGPLQRVSLLERVLEHAWWTLAEDVWNFGGTLERERAEFHILFVAPEYYFTRSDAIRQMSQADKDNVVGRLGAISRQYGDGLILVPGTIAWKKPVFRTGEYIFKKDKATGLRTREIKRSNRLTKFEDRVRYGATLRSALSIDVAEREASRFDGMAHDLRVQSHLTRDDLILDHWRRADDERDRALNRMGVEYARQPRLCFIARNTLYGFHGGAEVMRRHKWISFNEVTAQEAIDGGIVIFEPGGENVRESFTASGITFAGEICAEHAAGYLAQRRVQAPDVQILVSAATPLLPQYVYVPRNGYVVHASSHDQFTAIFENDGTGLVPVQTQDEPVERGIVRWARLRFAR
jgi:hypothetical protein